MTTVATRNLSKDYGPMRVVSGVDVEFHSGSIHALLGENGAGKSTLTKMIAGVVSPSEGEVLIDGEPVALRSVRDGQAAGIVALPQEIVLVGTLDAAENIYLGMRRPGRTGLVDRRRLRRDAAELLEGLGQDIPADVPVQELSAVQQTMIALARALVRDARLLILDEPTAALTDTETAQLFRVLRSLRDRGTAIIYVSHRLDEVFDLADTATVMRNGHLVWTRPIGETSTDEVVTAMIGRNPDQLFPDRAGVRGEVVLSAENLRGHTVRDVSLEARSGEVLGIAGLAGSGRSETLKMLAGAERPRSGTITLAGRDVTQAPLARRMDAGIGYVPEERRREGLVLAHTIEQNIALGSLRLLSRAGIVNSARERGLAERQFTDLQVRARSPRQLVGELSGGNQQKVVLARYLARHPRVLLLDEPTKGIDIGTKAEIYHLIRGLATVGMAVVVVSSEISELLGIADDIVVLHEGLVAGTTSAENADEESVLRLAHGKDAA